MIVIDVETECDVTDCKKGSDCWTKHKHGLIPHYNRITCIGIHDAKLEKSQVVRDLSSFKQLVESWYNEGREIINHETKFDLKVLCYHLYGYDPTPSEKLISMWRHDTKLMAYVMADKIPEDWMQTYEAERVEVNKELPRGYSHRKAGVHSLKTLAPFHLNVPKFWEDPTNHDNDEYVIKDVEYTWGLYKTLRDKMTQHEWEFYESCQFPWAKELLRAEILGVKLDKARLEAKTKEALKRRDEAYAKLWEQWGSHIGEDFNFNSPKQLQELLGEKLGYDITKEEGAEVKLSTDKEVLQRLAAQGHEDIQVFFDYRLWDKLCRTYYPSYETFDYKGRIHCSFNPAITRTGRLSSSFPNLQNQPKTTREIFIPDPGHKFLIADLSAIEPALIGYFSGDDNLLQLLDEGGNFHNNTAPVIFPYINCPRERVKDLYPAERALSKTAGLSILYGTGAKKLKSTLEKAGFQGYTMADCKRIINNVRTYYRGVWEFKKALDRVLEQGEVMYNLFGRPLRIAKKDDVYMKGFNSLIQGSASDIVQNAFYRFNSQPEYSVEGGKCLITIHDEIVAQVPEGRADEGLKKLKLAMTDYDLTRKGIRIKLEAEGDIYDRWVKE